MSAITILIGAWLMVIGYGVFYIGFKNWNGQGVSFADAFFPKGTVPTSVSANPIQATGGSQVVPGAGGASIQP